MNALFYVDVIDQGTQSWIFNEFFSIFRVLWLLMPLLLSLKTSQKLFLPLIQSRILQNQQLQVKLMPYKNMTNSL